MSAAPRPYSQPSRSVGTNGSDCHCGERAGRHDVGVAGEADERARRSPAHHPFVTEFDDERLGAKAERGKARCHQLLAARVVGRERAALDQRARQRERVAERRCDAGGLARSMRKTGRRDARDAEGPEGVVRARPAASAAGPACPARSCNSVKSLSSSAAASSASSPRAMRRRGRSARSG